jgi:hypothetical protein
VRIRIAALVLGSAACWTSSPPAIPRARSAATRDPIDAACERLLAANARVDAAAREAFVAAQRRGEVHESWGMGEPWRGECARAAVGAWCIRLDAASYGGVHSATSTIVHVGRTGVATPATDSVTFNYVAFDLLVDSDGTATASYESEGPEENHTFSVRYVWDGSVHAEPEESHE